MTKRTSLYRADVHATPRKKLTRHERIKVWEKTDGVCILCKQPIDRQKESWIGEHIIPLALGGPDTPLNMGPAHVACADAKTKVDKGDIARAKKRKARDIGAANEPRHPLKGRSQFASKAPAAISGPTESKSKHKSHLGHLGPPRLYRSATP